MFFFFCVDYLAHPTSSTTFDSKHRAWSQISVFGAEIMKVAYGIEVQESNDPYILIAGESLLVAHEAGIEGAFWVDLFPVFEYVPSGFPGAEFQKKAAYPFPLCEGTICRSFSFFFEISILEKIGNATPSVATSLIGRLPDENDPHRPMEENIAKNVTAMAYVGP